MNSQEAKKLEEKIIKQLQKTIKTNSVIIGVSGGADSIFLYEMLKLAKITSYIAHINHQLRGKNSDADEEFVKKLDTKTFIEKADIKSLSKKNKTGLEETGRNVRYKFFNKLAKEKNSNFILTAHHADDNLETILLNLTRGANLKGLSGMNEIEESSNKIRLYRPLLFISKKEIVEYLNLKEIKYREDESNKESIYTRNHMRLNIIPALKKINPNLTKTIAKNAENLKNLNTNLENNAKRWLEENSKNNKLNANKFREKNSSLQQYILIEYYRNFIGESRNIELKHIQECLDLINNNIGNKKKKIGKANLSIKNNIISLEKIVKKVQYKDQL